MGASKAQRAATAERRAKNIALRLAGAEWDDIARTLGYADKAAAYKDFQRAMEASIAEQTHNATVLREEELRRLNRLQRGLWPAASAGDTEAARVVLGISKERRRLLGIDLLAPLAEDGETYDQREALRRQGAVLAQIAARFVENMGLNSADPAVWKAMRDAVQSVTGVAHAPAITQSVEVIDGTAA